MDARSTAGDRPEADRTSATGEARLGNAIARKRIWHIMSKDTEGTPLLHDRQPSLARRALSYVVHQAPMIILLLVVIGLGSANRVLYKIQLTPMGNYPLFLGWIITSM